MQFLVPIIMAAVVTYAILRVRRKGGLWWLVVAILAVVASPFVYMAWAFGGPRGIVGLFLEVGFLLLPLWVGILVYWLAKPIGSMFDGGDEEPDASPFYYIAEACRRKGNYHEAIQRVQDQLAKFPDDYAGLMLLAGIQAEDFEDLAAARATVDQIVGKAERPSVDVVFALGRLADWYLKIEGNKERARAALVRIIELFPTTEHANKATMRLAALEK